MAKIIAQNPIVGRESENCQITSNASSKMAGRRVKLKEAEISNCKVK